MFQMFEVLLVRLTLYIHRDINKYQMKECWTYFTLAVNLKGLIKLSI